MCDRRKTRPVRGSGKSTEVGVERRMFQRCLDLVLNGKQEFDQRGTDSVEEEKGALQLFTGITDWGSYVRECSKESSVLSLDRLRVLVMI